MSPAEYLELLQLTSDGTGGHASNAFSTIIAYLIAAYFVGANLSRFQSISVSIVYSLYLTNPIRAALRGFDRLGTLNLEFLREHPEIAEIYIGTPELAYDFYQILFILVLLSAWVLSISFMITARKSAANVPIVT